MMAVLMTWLAIAAAAFQAPADADPLSAELVAARRLAASEGERLWPGLGTAPFGVLLVRPEGETLLCQPSLPQGFIAAGQDAATGCTRATRPRSALPGNLLAAMPLFGPPSTIVVGTPAATGLSLPRWRATLQHEHFHQWQSALPDYYSRTAALDLAGDDTTGMWMLNYPFPYEQPAVAQAHAEASRALAAALASPRDGSQLPQLASRYLALRRAFAAAAGERSWSYFEFQLWQEGVARWTEIMLADREDAAAQQSLLRTALEQPDLRRDGRLTVYALGAGEAILMEACGLDWRRDYARLLALGPLLERAATDCRPAT
jgi:hypothetical protein